MCEENFGGRLGRKLGNMGYDYLNDAFQTSAVGKSFKRAKEWFGNGDYTIRANSIIDTGGDPGNLKMITNGNPWTDFIFREYLGDISAPSTPAAFNSTSYSINPGLVQLHPWLAPIAQQFEQYEPMGIVFEFKSLLSDYSSNQVLGSVMMATDYDPSDPPYASKLEFMNAQYSSQAKPTEGLLHGIECDPSQRPTHLLYVRSGDLASTEDIKDYDLGNFQIATQGLGVAAGTIIGSLFVHYHYRFYKNQLSNGLLQKGTLSALVGAQVSVANAYSSIVYKYNNLGVTWAANVLTFPTWLSTGIFLITINVRRDGSGTLPTTSIVDAFVFNNCALANNEAGEKFFNTATTANTANLFLEVDGADTLFSGCGVWAIQITAVNASVQFNTVFGHTSLFTLYVVNVGNFEQI